MRKRYAKPPLAREPLPLRLLLDHHGSLCPWHQRSGRGKGAEAGGGLTVWLRRCVRFGGSCVWRGNFPRAARALERVCI